MGIKITGFETHDVRFPTSLQLDGSDAMNPNPDYSAAYLIISTDSPDGSAGYSYAFTIGRGNDVQLAAIRALEPFLAGRDLDDVLDDLGGLSAELTGDSQLRWLGPACGVMQMAIGAVLNACWDLAARRAGQPLWRFLAGLTPAQLVSCVDFRYLTDALTHAQALDLLERGADGKAERISRLEREGYPAYATSPGWLGYTDDKLVALCREAAQAGFTRIKLKVGANLEDDRRRLRLARDAVGDDVAIAIDANQVWDVPAAIAWMRELAPLRPDWIEEPTSPDDILGLAAIRRAISPVRVATGEHVANRVIFKQLLQAEAIDMMQIDACRVAGVSENLANLLLAARFGIPVCPHAGGVGLCELVQHLAMFDYVALSGTTADGPSSGSITCTSTSSPPPSSEKAATGPRRLPAHRPSCGASRSRPTRSRPDRPGGLAGKDQFMSGPVELGAATGLRVTRLMFGTAPIGGLFTPVSAEAAHGHAGGGVAGGIRAFDTAPHYGVGQAEQRLGAFLATRPRTDYLFPRKSAGGSCRRRPDRRRRGLLRHPAAGTGLGLQRRRRAPVDRGESGTTRTRPD